MAIYYITTPFIEQKIYDKTKQFIDLIKSTNNGQDIYAFACQLNKNKNSFCLLQKPVKGQLTHYDVQHLESKLREKQTQKKNIDAHPYWFIPYNKSQTGLCWSKAVAIQNRSYATTLNEAIKAYNSQLQEILNWHEEQIRHLKTYLV